MDKPGEEDAVLRREHEEAVELAGERVGDAITEARLVGCERGGGWGEGDGEEGERGGGVGRGVEEGEEGRVLLDHGEEGAGRGRVEVGAAAREDAEGEEFLRFGEKQSCQFAGESEAAVLRGAEVQRRASDRLHRR